MSPVQLLDTPINLFWSLYRRCGQIEAERALGDIQVMSTAFHGGEKSSQYINQLKEVAGRPVVIEEKLDREGLNELKRLQKAMM